MQFHLIDRWLRFLVSITQNLLVLVWITAIWHSNHNQAGTNFSIYISLFSPQYVMYSCVMVAYSVCVYSIGGRVCLQWYCHCGVVWVMESLCQSSSSSSLTVSTGPAGKTSISDSSFQTLGFYFLSFQGFVSKLVASALFVLSGLQFKEGPVVASTLCSTSVVGRQLVWSLARSQGGWAELQRCFEDAATRERHETQTGESAEMFPSTFHHPDSLKTKKCMLA